MENINLFLFCGGLAIDSAGGPKPLMKINNSKSLIKHYLEHLSSNETPPETITILCDIGQRDIFLLELSKFKFSVPIKILECNIGSSTFDKFLTALEHHEGEKSIMHFSYPDIFFFGDTPQVEKFNKVLNEGVAISVAALTSRFPRLIVDIYNNQIKGISDHTSAMPANPLHVFGGDIWGRVDVLKRLSKDFLSDTSVLKPTLEYDMFFWLINREQVSSVMLYGDWLLVDSDRDVRRLLNRQQS
jgi:NDP-sugar pyrophosphorylase family protein